MMFRTRTNTRLVRVVPRRMIRRRGRQRRDDSSPKANVNVRGPDPLHFPRAVTTACCCASERAMSTDDERSTLHVLTESPVGSDHV